MKHDHRCACLVCGLRRDLAPAVRCRECGIWYERPELTTHEEAELRRDSRWPEWLRIGRGRR